MSMNNSKETLIESEFIKLNIFDENSVAINHGNCRPWCKECVPSCIIEGWTSGNDEIDNFIKDTIYSARYFHNKLEWVPFDRFEDIKQIGEGGFAKVYSAKWIDGQTVYYKHGESWKKSKSEPMNVALKKLNGSR